MQGRIIKGIGGFYSILLEDGQVFTAKARGRFRNEGVTPMVGDLVEISFPETGYSSMDEILPRRNALLRPPVSNIDLLVIVLSAGVPKPDFLLADKLLIQAHTLKIEPLLVLNKIDAAKPAIMNTFLSDYTAFRSLLVSSSSGEGIDALKLALTGRVSCFAGQSAVGKSSLLNALFPGLSLETGELTRKTDRGRHTTRQAELWPFLGGAVLDTPGFSLFEMSELSQDALNTCYPEFSGVFTQCRFSGCRHNAEPDCAVKSLLEQGKLAEGRFKRYLEIQKEIEEKHKHRYD
ncbi:MAG: ribosome small subunit-dependent GTPase A [Eubacteriales bacterium]|jgi:ribosome biogenesis GTPase|nr:ribosome small subunit-dependent GTPase A [Eubacteriales bacterium]